MCGRFFITFKYADIKKEFNIKKTLAKFSSNYNVAPSQSVPVVTQDHELDVYRWGLIPHWAKDKRISYKMINARAETVTEKSSYKGPFLHHRVLIPASGFFEWKRSKNEKQPFIIKRKDGKPMAFAGISATWTSQEGLEIKSCSIITTESSGAMKKIHDRMPVILDAYDEYLESDKKARMLLKSFSKLEMYEVSDMVNSSRNNRKEILVPI